MHKSHIWERSCSWDLGQNALSQSDCRIFKWTVSPEQIYETASFLLIDKNSQKLKFDRECFGYVWSKMGMASNVIGF